MSPRKIQVTSDQLARLLDDLGALPEETVGEHLSDDQFISYSLSILSPEETSIVEQHLTSCSECTTEMEHLLEAAEAWNQKTTRDESARRTIDEYAAALETSKEGQERTTLHLVARSLLKLLTATDEIFSEYTKAWAAEAKNMTSRKVWSYSDSKSVVDGKCFLDSNGDLIIVFTSKHVELENRRLRLQISSQEDEVTKEKVLETNDAKTEVGATFVIPRYQLPREVDQVLVELEEAE